MADGLAWSAAQWERVNREVTEAFEKANVVGKFLPKYGPLPDSAEYVKDETLDYAIDQTVDAGSPGTQLRVNDDTSLKLFNLTVHVVLSREQIAEESLSSALLAFRRAANMLAQAEDRLVFSGHRRERFARAKQSSDEATRERQRAREDLERKKSALAAARDERITAENAGAKAGLEHSVLAEYRAARAVREAEAALEAKTNAELKAIASARDEAVNHSLDNPARPGLIEKSEQFTQQPVQGKNDKEAGEDLVKAVAAATARLERHFHPGPFACVLGTELFRAAHTPAPSGLVLPADRIKSLLNGTSASMTSSDRLLFQCGQLPASTGVVVALAGGDIDLVVATPARVELLQVNLQAKYVFRVYEKFIWRIKDPKAVVVLVSELPPAT